MRLEMYHRVDARLMGLLVKLVEQEATIMAQLDDLQLALRDLSGKVDALIAAQTKPTDLTGVLQQVADIDAKVTAATPAPAA